MHKQIIFYMTKIKKGRPNVWPKGTLKPLNLGNYPARLHRQIKQIANGLKAEELKKIKGG